MEKTSEKIALGLKKSFEILIEYKKYKKTPLVISEGGKIIFKDVNDINA